jgi:hypothetical protein
MLESGGGCDDHGRTSLRGLPRGYMLSIDVGRDGMTVLVNRIAEYSAVG